METRNADAPLPVGRSGSFVAGCGLGLLLVVAVGSVVFLRARGVELEKRRLTLEALAACARSMEAYPKAPPRSVGAGDDWTGMRAAGLEGRAEATDGWGHPIRYRCPGGVHPRGFDFYSCGPNGKDDSGTFDDLVAGSDVAAIGS